MTKYTYTKNPVSIDRLTQEIKNSTITIVLDYINTFGDLLDIIFKADISLEEKSILDNIVSTHNGLPLPITDTTKIVGEVSLVDNSIVTPTAPKNEYCMQPYGSVKGHIVSSEKACPITLSNKQSDGFTFTYSCTLIPALGDYIFQKNFTKRAYIIAINNIDNTLTVSGDDDCDILDEGIGHYSCGEWIDCKIVNWNSCTYLWGAILKVIWSKANIVDDFIELSIIDHSDLFKNDEYCQAVFGCTANYVSPILLNMGFEYSDEYSHWTKYYDQSWVITCNSKDMKTPDGSPGQIPCGLYLRLSYFTSVSDDTITDIYIDYYPTNKE